MSDRVWHKGPPPHVLDAQTMHELFDYDPETGSLVWRRTVCARVQKGRHAGTPSGKGYLRVMVSGKNYYVHRIAYAMTWGSWPEQIDHIDGDRSNNRISNLRGVTNLINSHNVRRKKLGNTGVRGIYFNKRFSSFYATIFANRKRIYVGAFKNLSDAEAAVNAAREKHQSAWRLAA